MVTVSEPAQRMPAVCAGASGPAAVGDEVPRKLIVPLFCKIGRAHV